jgi:hypothetical protein
MDESHEYWFRKRTLGWGWSPANWMGWLVVAVFFGLFFLGRIVLRANQGSSWANEGVFAIYVILLAIALVAVSYLKSDHRKRLQ